MKFRDPKTEDVFEDITEVADSFCFLQDCDFNHCPIDGKTDGQSCADFCREHPIEAARMMGYEIIEDDKMEKKEKSAMGERQDGKPRICEVLGVEPGERFTYPGMVGEFYVAENGTLISVGDDGEDQMMCASTLINRHDRIIRKPRFTEYEVAFLRVLHASGVTYIARDINGSIRAFNEMPTKTTIGVGELGDVLHQEEFWSGIGHFMNDKVLPSIRPGQSVKLEDIIAADD